MAFVRHGTLTANEVTTVELPDVKIDSVEVLSVDGAAAIYFVVVDNGSSVAPTVAGDDCEVLPAVISSTTVDNPPDGPTAQVKLISTGTPKYSVRAS